VTEAETARLLTMIAAYDQRTLGESDVIAWHAVIGRVSFEAAKHAVVNYYARSRYRMMPCDVIAGSIPPREEWMHRP
jgi:hypothetical protein